MGRRESNPRNAGFKAQHQDRLVPKLDGEVGIEPTNASTKNWWLTTCRLPKENWMGHKESNLDLQDQNLSPYR